MPPAGGGLVSATHDARLPVHAQPLTAQRGLGSRALTNPPAGQERPRLNIISSDTLSLLRDWPPHFQNKVNSEVLG